ncbi:YeeE/YedE family protein [Tistrella mobilis]|uniref:YeeE/YedE family protein n=1 Tax=Tistrella mobilis TaxID=171437 RepID=UPI0035583A76
MTPEMIQSWSIALIGGVLIGAAAVWLMAAQGRIMGVSGILAGLLPPKPAAGDDRGWRITFALGLIGGPLIVQAVTGAPATGAPVVSLPLLVVAGLLVGFGTVIGSGCTSGHGVCGLSRLSPRSLVATGTFMATGALTVLVMRHLI